jgi:L-asparaginase
MKPRVAFIGTGGTIASVGRDPLDTVDYGATGRLLEAEAILARFPEVQEVAEVIPAPYKAIPSTRVAWPSPASSSATARLRWRRRRISSR